MICTNLENCSSKKNPSQANLSDGMFTEFVSDMAFILRSESKRFGSQYIREMLPIPKRFYNGVPDFCPDPARALGLAGTSTSLLPAIIMRIIATAILSNEILLGSDLDDNIREVSICILQQIYLYKTSSIHSEMRSTLFGFALDHFLFLLNSNIIIV